METSLYYHYKNKPYRFLGIVRHSETLGELALYETRYENQLGKIWVRPREMFFESVKVDGVEVPRFRKAEILVSVKRNLSEKDRNDLKALFSTALVALTIPQEQESPVFCFAQNEGKLIGSLVGIGSKKETIEINNIWVA